MVTSQKYVIMQAQEGYETSGPTYLKMLYLDTSPTFFVPGVSKGSSQILGEKSISNLFVVSANLNAGRPDHVAKMVLDVIEEPEQWFTSCMQLINYMLKNPKALQTHKVQKEVWIELYKRTSAQPLFRFYEESFGFCIIRLGMKYLSLNMADDALYLAFRSKIPQLLTACKHYAKHKSNMAVENLISYHEEKTNPGSSSSLIKAMTQIANFSGK